MLNIEPSNLDINQEIRIFISSTFRDMQEERDELIKYIFPHLKQICLERGVILTDIDLRWGITEEQAEKKEVIPICLKEIDNSRPFFIGILGDRYGWVPDQLEDELLFQFPWLNNFRNISVTEMEIRHGVLNNPAVASHALFYFRDPSYYNQIPKSRKTDYLEQNPEAVRKLNALKQELLQSGIKVHENYKSPQEVGHQILQDITQIIDQEIPENPLLKKRVPLYQEMMGKEDGPKGTPNEYFHKQKILQKPFTDSLRKSFTVRSEYFDILDDFVNNQRSGLVLHGLKGIGKSALLVNWVDHYQQQYPDVCVVSYHVGHSYSNTLDKVLLQICWELNEFFHFNLELDIHSKSRDIFLETLELVDKKGVALIVIDGLDKLTDKDKALGLDWLPLELPSNIQLILSLTASDPLNLGQKKNWFSKKIHGLTDSDKSQLIVDYLGQFSKSLTISQLSRLSNTEQVDNPLYLKTLLDELRIFGIYEKLDAKIDYYLKAQNTNELYQKIITRIEEDYDRAGENIAIMTFRSLACSRSGGFSEDELRGILQLTPLEWSLFYNGVNELLIKELGTIIFRDEELRSVIEQRYLSSSKEILETHLRIARFIQAQPDSSRKAHELPFHYIQAERWGELKNCLLNMGLFFRYEYDELIEYWKVLEGIYDPKVEYLTIVENMEDLFNLQAISRFFDFAGYTRGAEVILRKIIEVCEATENTNSINMTTALNDLAILLERSGHEEEAESLFQRVLFIKEDVYTMTYLGALYAKQKKYQKAELLYRKALAITETNPKSYKYIIPEISTAMANLFCETNRYEEAELYYRRAVEVKENVYTLKNLVDFLKTLNRIQEVESLYRRILEVTESDVKGDYSINANSSNELANILYQKNEYNEAEILYQRALALYEQNERSDNANIATILTNLANLYHSTNRLKKAEQFIRRALKIYENMYEKFHPKIADSLNQLGLLLVELYRYQEVEPLYQRALSIYEYNYGRDDSTVAKIFCNLAILYSYTNRREEAEDFYRRALIIDEKILGCLGVQLKERQEYQKAEESFNRALDIFETNYGENHVTIASVLFNLASLHIATERYQKAERLYSRALTFYEATYGSNHPMVGKTLTGLARVSKNLKRYQEAEDLVQRAINIFEKNYGNDHFSLCSRLFTLSEILYETNRTEATISTLERALNINERSKTPDKQLIEKIRKKLDKIKNT
jgi:tetratricopeptide (TPR) repeat protein